MIDCLTCAFAKRDDNGNFLDRCSGYGNCSYEKHESNIVHQNNNLPNYIEQLLCKYDYTNTQYSKDYITGIRDGLSFIQQWYNDNIKEND